MKLIETLSVLNKNEWLSLRKFLQMNHRDGSDVLDLFLILNKLRNKLNGDSLTESIKKKSFSRLTQKAYLNIYSKIYQEFEDWAVYFDMKNDKTKYSLQLVKSLNSRSLYKQATQTAVKLEKQLHSEKTLSIEKQGYLSELYHSQYYSNNPIKGNRPELLKLTVDCTINFQRNKLLIYDCELRNWGAVKNIDFEKESNIILQIFKSSESDTISKDLKDMKRFIETSKLEDFFRFSELVMNGRYTVGSETHLIIASYLIRIGTRCWTKYGNQEVGEKLYELLEQGMSEGVFFKRSKMTIISFINQFNIVCNVTTKENSLAFLEKWIGFIKTNDVEGIRSYSLANLYYAHEEYEKIIDILKSKVISDSYLEYRSIALLIIAYAENLDSYYELLKNTIENHKRQLRRNKEKVSKIIFHATLNFLEVVDTISDFKFTKKKVDISQYENIYYRQWVEKKIKQGY